uniref:CRAL-TRIO domain-containing protein n=1 Tax=Spongospora subterranea TaxID=70186 RepID=A0A0H5R6F9_9EUKA|eukprot:CRZ09421.1 hypothetical protein [Spongospora subterranea]
MSRSDSISNNPALLAPGVPPESAPLSPDDQEIYKKLEETFAADMPIEPQMLIRFVRGYRKEKDRFDTTVSKLRETLEWRKQNNVDTILASPLPNEAKYFELWPHDFHGISKCGHPVYYENPCFTDPSLLLQTFNIEDQRRFHTQMMEMIQKIKKKCERDSGHQTYKAVVVVDLAGLTRHHMGSQFTEPFRAQINIDQYYYPESLQTLFVINAPFIFRMLWGMVKPWLHPLTAARIKILGSDYLSSLRELVSDDQIPAYYGGSCSCCPQGKSFGELHAVTYSKFVALRDQLNQLE